MEVPGSVLGLGGTVIMNAIIGFDATVASMLAGGSRDPAELGIGTLGGGFGGALDFELWRLWCDRGPPGASRWWPCQLGPDGHPESDHRAVQSAST